MQNVGDTRLKYAIVSLLIEEISAEDIPFNNLKPPEIIDIMLQVQLVLP